LRVALEDFRIEIDHGRRREVRLQTEMACCERSSCFDFVMDPPANDAGLSLRRALRSTLPGLLQAISKTVRPEPFDKFRTASALATQSKRNDF
jgi:hypothetical protein